MYDPSQVACGRRLQSRPHGCPGLAPLPAFAMGVLTGCLGGIVRDVLAGEPSILLRPELYVTAAALSAYSGSARNMNP